MAAFFFLPKGFESTVDKVSCARGPYPIAKEIDRSGWGRGLGWRKGGNKGVGRSPGRGEQQFEESPPTCSNTCKHVLYKTIAQQLFCIKTIEQNCVVSNTSAQNLCFIVKELHRNFFLYQEVVNTISHTSFMCSA